MDRKIVVLAVTLLAVATLATPVLALGPIKAGEVGHNPHLTITVVPGGPTAAHLDGPGETSILWIDRPIQPDFVIFLVSASKGEGKMNSAIIASGANWLTILSNPADYYNQWIYLSGEEYGNKWNNPLDIPDRGEHGMFYWGLRMGMGFDHDSALATAESHPDGVFRRMVPVG